MRPKSRLLCVYTAVSVRVMKSVNTDVAYDFIRKKILSGEYSPGRALMTESLAKDIGVSRTPVRDAFRKLEADGLVTIRAHLGASVKKMDLKEFCEMCELRLALESHAAGLAAKNRTTADLHEIEFALDNMRRLTERLVVAEREQPILGELMREDVRFHIAIITAAKNEVIKKEILRLHLVNRLISGHSSAEDPPRDKAAMAARRRSSLAKHEEIYSAIERSDAAGAKAAMESSLQEMIDHTLLQMRRAETGVITRELTPDEIAYSS